MASDEDLIDAVARGDGAALEGLCRRHERSLHAVLWRWTGGRDVDDLYQETWLRVVRGASQFERGRRFRPWLFGIAVNLARDWRRRPPPDPVGDATDAGGVDARGSDPADAAIDARRLLAALPEAQRAVVLLRYYEDLPEDEVAEILGIPRGTVKSRLHNALARLGEMVREGASR